ncbi:MAG: HDIG domain-containing protein, partial [Candidatus Omnitrophica bacterium]|nr:HDIG domain-containing protein [Candidatus Omnitrophota bacterium]
KFVLGAILTYLMSFILQINLIVPTFLISLFLFFSSAYRNANLKDYRFLNLILLFVIIFVSGYYIVNHGLLIYYLPFPILPMLSTMLFGELGISLLLTVASSVSLACIAGNHFNLAVLFLISGLLSSLLTQEVHRRIGIIRIGFIIGITQALSLFLINGFKLSESNNYIILIVNGIASSIIAIGILPIFEYLFKTVTNISLLELADFNQPLLQRMILEAPGTYHHSLMVGNLSEAACGAVGAKALLARIGSYYHDIGKLYRPDYFSENQIIKESKHDTLSPSMSKMVIMNHVKEGVELAKKYKLNSRIIDFIKQHHGNSLVYYFYQRALQNVEEDEEVKEEGFRYPWPKPNTKETAIVLLADSVEAAVRSLKEPTPENIKEVVHTVINNKFIDGQLDECDLTLKDMDKISAVFIHLLSGIHHSRVTYPESLKSEPRPSLKNGKK